MNRIIKYFLENRVITFILLLAIIFGGIATAPFPWDIDFLPRNPVPVDAIPDLGENQQIVYTEWPGRSPQDVEDQITYPLSTALMGVPGVKTIRSTSMFGASVIYVIFKENVEFYWSRSRILEKLNSLPEGLLPPDATPTLGPDATALGQIFWYTLEGLDPKTGKNVGGWDLHELRTLQDFYIKYLLTAVDGVAEVAGIGGYVKEYQIDLDPEAMKAFNVTVEDVYKAIVQSNLDVGARTLEFNKVEYLIRGIGYIRSLNDLEQSVVKEYNHTPVRIKDIAYVSIGPAPRRGGLDKDGMEAVGGVVVARFGSNPMKTIENVKNAIKKIQQSLPKKELSDGTISQVTIVPFYDRSVLIRETLGTLESAINHEILITILVVVVLIFNLKASFIISGLLPVGVLLSFIFMRWTGVEANIVALSGIAIAIGVMVDIGIVFTENIIRHIELLPEENPSGKALLNTIFQATSEVSGAILTALSTTLISFLPVFALEGPEGKLFHPLATTKTLALAGSFILGVFILPTLAYWFFSIRITRLKWKKISYLILCLAGIYLLIFFKNFLGLTALLYGSIALLEDYWPQKIWFTSTKAQLIVIILTVIYYLTHEWLPLGPQQLFIVNFLFVGFITTIVLGVLYLMVFFYVPVLRWALENKVKFLIIPAFTIFFGCLSYWGADKIFGFLPESMKKSSLFHYFSQTFPGLGKEFMPDLDEGSFLLMPSTMPHSGVEENTEVIAQLDRSVSSIPEVELTVGKWGRVNSALDPAPISMFENIINYLPEYKTDQNGRRLRFKVDEQGRFILKNGHRYAYGKDPFRKIPTDSLIIDPDGEYFRQWRPHIHSPDDIWQEIVEKTDFPGLTSAPKLQPIQTRLVMLQTGMRAPMGIKIYGPDLKTLEQAGLMLEKALKEVPGIEPNSVFADRVVGKPYLEIIPKREWLSRYGLTVKQFQEQLELLVGGKTITTTVEGRERYPVRLRYPREWLDQPEQLKKILFSTPSGSFVPLELIADIKFERGPQMIKSENTFLTSYVIFDKKENWAEVNVVEQANIYLQKKINSGQLKLPQGVTYEFTGNYENQIRATKRLMIIIPASLILIFLLLYMQFKSITASTIHFSGVFVALAGGFIMLWLYSQPWFLNFEIAGVPMRDLFQVHTINMSVAVWVGFISLFGIATDDGVIMGTYIHETFLKNNPQTIEEVRLSVIEAGKKRVRPAMMTAATTIISLIPVITSTGKGSDILVPMAIPTFGGMLIQLMTIFMVPVFQCIWRENAIKKQKTLNT